jgi:transposase
MDSHTHRAFGRLEIVETGRRRRWTDEEKRRIVLESMSGPRLISETARRHGISRTLLLTWRRLMASEVPSGFVPAIVVPEPPVGAPVPRDQRGARVEIVLVDGRRLIVEGAINVEVILRLARGLEAPR